MNPKSCDKKNFLWTLKAVNNFLWTLKAVKIFSRTLKVGKIFLWTLKAVKDFSHLSKSSNMFDRHQVTRSLGINYCDLTPLCGEAVTHRDILNFRADLPWRASLSSWPEAVESSPLFCQRSHFLHRHLPSYPPHWLLCLVLPLIPLLPPSTPFSTTIHPCPVLPAVTPALASLVCLLPALVVPALWRR